MRHWRAHVLLSVLYISTRLLLYQSGLRFSFSLDWMWLADPADLTRRLSETLFYFHAFPPGINALTGALLKLGGADAATVAHLAFVVLGLILVNSLFYLARAVRLPTRGAAAFSLAFSLMPATIYFEHLYHYEWPVITLLSVAAVLFHRGTRQSSLLVWLAFFATIAAASFTRSTFHLAWFVALAGLAAFLTPRTARRQVVIAAVVPFALLVALYSKNLVLFGDFAASTFGPASYTLVTVNHLPQDVREAWIKDGQLSPYAAISVYAPPRAYSRFFATPVHDEWPPQLTRLEHSGVRAPNFNHWWLLEVHRARRADVMHYLTTRPGEYAATVLGGIRDVFRPSTTWHPRDGGEGSPHFQHRQVLGRYERLFNRAVHDPLLPPFGVYVVLPLLLAWIGLHTRHLVHAADSGERAYGALLLFCVFHIVYVVLASSMLTDLESSRYRFQAEWAIWLVAAAGVARLAAAGWRGRHRTTRPAGHAARQMASDIDVNVNAASFSGGTM